MKTGIKATAGAGLVLAVVVGIVILATGAGRLRDVRSATVRCASAAEDGGSTAVTCGAGGFNEALCSCCWDVDGGAVTRAAYFGGSNVTAKNGQPVCSETSCVSNAISIETNLGEWYCVAPSAVDGGTHARCTCGW